jgi:hypothetical protein
MGAGHQPEDEDAEPVRSPFPNPSGLVFPGLISGSMNLVDSFPSTLYSFILWQKFLSNVNPLTKVIHQPTLQEKLVNANKDFTKVSRPLAALLFAIYAAAVNSMTEDECRKEFQEDRTTLLARYVGAAQRALVDANFLGSMNLMVLQAFVIYLGSIRRVTDAQTFHMLTGMAVRMCMRKKMHIYGEDAGVVKCSVFEEQMRRRIW